MVSMEEIQAVGERIGREFHPQRVILFGSHAQGTAREDSDVDLLVIMPFRGRSFAKSIEVLAKVQPRFPVDLLVRTPQEVRRRIAMGDYFIQDIVETGKVLYETDRRRVGR
jgi:uncharacterized protein